MTYCSTYIGDLDHPEFKWEGGDWSGNIPPRLGPLFPPACTDTDEDTIGHITTHECNHDQ